MKKKIAIKVGQRFEIYGSEYEVCFVDKKQVRYASAIGGKSFNVSRDRYKELIIENNMLLDDDGKQIWPDEISDEEASEMTRKLEYIRYVSKKTKKNRSKKKVIKFIKKSAKKQKDKNPPAPSTLAKWTKIYVDSLNNPMSLVNKHRFKGNRYSRFDLDIERIINKNIEEFYNNPQKASCASVYQRTKKEIEVEYGLQGIIPPSERTINARIHKVDSYHRVASREGKYKANRLYKAAGKSIWVNRAMEVVEADGNKLDVLIVDEDTGEIAGRAFGSCILDVYTRCVLAFFITIKPFSTATLLEAFKLAISNKGTGFGGVMEIFIVDNGSDYASASIKNVCSHTGINIEFAEPKDPNAKAHVERFFGRLNDQLIHLLPGTTFSNHVMKGDYKSEEYACVTITVLREFVQKWIDEVYHCTIHEGHKRVPKVLWAESIKYNPICEFPISKLEKIARTVFPRKVSKGRVTISNLKWYSHALATFEQELKTSGRSTTVNVYLNTYDISEVYIEDIKDKTMNIKAVSTTPEYTNGLSLDEHEAIHKELIKKGKEDLASLSDYQLQVARCELWENIDEYSKSYSRNKKAKLKELRNIEKSKKKAVIEEKENDKNQSKANTRNEHKDKNNETKELKSYGYIELDYD